MNTQNTPMHIRSWQREFWQMSLANMLFTLSMYMLLPVMPIWLIRDCGFTPVQTGVSIGIFGLGLFLLGGFCSYLVNNYRRNVVCFRLVLLTILCTEAFCYSDDFMHISYTFAFILLLRLLQGTCFGLAKMVLGSTLIIDVSESSRRTEANFSFAWIERFALALGPLVGLFVYFYFGMKIMFQVSALSGILALLLMATVKFPFRTPQKCSLYSTDRFFMSKGLVLFLNFLPISMVAGMLIAMQSPAMLVGSQRSLLMFYVILFAGLLFSMLVQNNVFSNADIRSEVYTGLILLLVAILLFMTHFREEEYYISAFLFGMSFGLIAARFLMFFIKLSDHCQRGTSLSTFMLSWEFGLMLGFTLYFVLMYQYPNVVLYLFLGLLILFFLMYRFFTNEWYWTHRNR